MPTAVAERTRRTPDDAVDGALDREGDERFHLLGRHAVAFGEDGDRRRGEIRKHVDRHRPRRPDAGREQQDRQRDDDPVMVDRPLNESFHRSPVRCGPSVHSVRLQPDRQCTCPRGSRRR